MRTKVLLAAVFTALFAAPGAPAADSFSTTSELMPGVTYTREVKRIRGKQVLLHVVTAPKPGGLYRLVPVLSNGTITGRETVTDMQARLSSEATVVGINGDLFNWEHGYPSGIYMREGALHGRPTSDRSTLGIGLDGLLRLARVGFFGTWRVVDLPREALTRLNRPLDQPGVGLFTPVWGAETPRVKGAVDVVLSGFPTTTPNTDLTGQIVEVRQGGGTPIPAGGAVLQATGPSKRRLATDAQPGLPLVVRLILKPWWEQVADAIGGGPALVRDGAIALPTTESFSSSQLLPRHPRTAVGQLADGRIVLVVVDGRRTWSAGVNLRDLANELVRLGVVTGMAFDAGGSTTAAFDAEVLNTPSDGPERSVSTALMMLYYGVYAPRPAAAVVSPNGDGVGESQRLAFKLVRPSTVLARLIGPGGKVLWKDQGAREPGTYPLEPAVEALGEGAYRWVVSATDGEGQESKAERRFFVNETLGFLDLSRTTLKLKARKAAKLAVSFQVSRRARLLVTVEDRVGRVLATLLEQVTKKPGEIGASWSGRSAGGTLVPGGRYMIRVHAENRFGPVDLVGSVVVRRA